MSKAERVQLDEDFWLDFEWWESFLPKWNGMGKWIQEQLEEVWTDASNRGFGGIWREETMAGHWFSSQREYHINWRELKAVELACIKWCNNWSNKRVLFHSDNLATVGVLNAGTCRSRAMMAVVRRVAMLAATFNFSFRAEYVPGVKNVIADRLSRLVVLPRRAVAEQELTKLEMVSRTLDKSWRRVYEADPSFKRELKVHSHILSTRRFVVQPSREFTGSRNKKRIREDSEAVDAILQPPRLECRWGSHGRGSDASSKVFGLQGKEAGQSRNLATSGVCRASLGRRKAREKGPVDGIAGNQKADEGSGKETEKSGEEGSPDHDEDAQEVGRAYKEEKWHGCANDGFIHSGILWIPETERSIGPALGRCESETCLGGTQNPTFQNRSSSQGRVSFIGKTKGQHLSSPLGEKMAEAKERNEVKVPFLRQQGEERDVPGFMGEADQKEGVSGGTQPRSLCRSQFSEGRSHCCSLGRSVISADPGAWEMEERGLQAVCGGSEEQKAGGDQQDQIEPKGVGT